MGFFDELKDKLLGDDKKDAKVDRPAEAPEASGAQAEQNLDPASAQWSPDYQAQVDAQARQQAAEAQRQAEEQAAAAQQAAQQRTYTVQEGDNLSWIGQQFGVDYMDIARINGIENPDLIYPGQVLQIP